MSWFKWWLFPLALAVLLAAYFHGGDRFYIWSAAVVWVAWGKKRRFI